MKDNILVRVAREVCFLFSKSTLILADGLAGAEILIPIYGSRWKHKRFAPLRVVFSIPSATQPLLFARLLFGLWRRLGNCDNKHRSAST
jgi:hypothetical protein